MHYSISEEIRYHNFQLAVRDLKTGGMFLLLHDKMGWYASEAQYFRIRLKNRSIGFLLFLDHVWEVQGIPQEMSSITAWSITCHSMILDCIPQPKLECTYLAMCSTKL